MEGMVRLPLLLLHQRAFVHGSHVGDVCVGKLITCSSLQDND